MKSFTFSLLLLINTLHLSVHPSRTHTLLELVSMNPKSPASTPGSPGQRNSGSRSEGRSSEQFWMSTLCLLSLLNTPQTALSNLTWLVPSSGQGLSNHRSIHPSSKPHSSTGVLEPLLSMRGGYTMDRSAVQHGVNMETNSHLQLIQSR